MVFKLNKKLLCKINQTIVKRSRVQIESHFNLLAQNLQLLPRHQALIVPLGLYHNISKNREMQHSTTSLGIQIQAEVCKRRSIHERREKKWRIRGECRQEDSRKPSNSTTTIRKGFVKHSQLWVFWTTDTNIVAIFMVDCIC